MEPVDYRPLAAIIAVAIVGAWNRYEARDRPRPAPPVQPWGDGLVGPEPAAAFSWRSRDTVLALGSLVAMVSIIVAGIISGITR